MTSFLRYYIAIFLIAMFLTSCASRSRVAYVQDIDGKTISDLVSYEPVIKADDILTIIISAENPELAASFNMTDLNSGAGGVSGGGGEGQSRGQRSYIVDIEGRINFPILGFVKLAGLTKREAITEMTKRIGEYITNPIINIRIQNFKVSVLGEVKSPGPISVNGERVSLLDAIASAGDLSIYGRRDNILIIRETDGKKTFTRVDITKSDFLTSPYFYLSQNDVVYVEPNQTRVNASVIGNDITTFISLTSLALTVTTFLILRL